MTEIKLNGEPVIINGMAKGAAGKIVSLITYSDQITFTEEKLTTAKIDSAGKFTLKADIQDVIQSFVKIEYYKSELYLEPGKVYEIIINTNQSYRNNSIVNPYLENTGLSMNIKNSDENELNNLISKFNGLYEFFIVNNFEELYRSRHKAALDSFNILINKSFRNVNNKYFEDFKFYKTGTIELMSKLKTNTDIEKQYFYKKPVLYNNVEYMELFNELYSKYLLTTKNISIRDVNKSINENNGDYENLLKLILRDTLINEGLGEMILFKELNELYHSNGYRKENILYMIQDAGIKMESNKNKQIAYNLYKLLTKLQTGTKAPNFNLTDTKGNKISLNNFKGKYIYLNFFKSNLKACLIEMQVMVSLYEKYKDKIEFVSICADNDADIMNSFLENNKNFKWTFAYFNNDIDLLDNYNVRAYPTFVLIDDEGNIADSAAPRPSEEVNRLFDKLIH